MNFTDMDGLALCNLSAVYTKKSYQRNFLFFLNNCFHNSLENVRKHKCLQNYIQF